MILTWLALFIRDIGAINSNNTTINVTKIMTINKNNSMIRNTNDS